MEQVLSSASWEPLLNDEPTANVALIKPIEQMNTALCQDYTQLWRTGLRIVCPSMEAVLLLRYCIPCAALNLAYNVRLTKVTTTTKTNNSSNNKKIISQPQQAILEGDTDVESFHSKQVLDEVITRRTLGTRVGPGSLTGYPVMCLKTTTTTTTMSQQLNGGL